MSPYRVRQAAAYLAICLVDLAVLAAVMAVLYVAMTVLAAGARPDSWDIGLAAVIFAGYAIGRPLLDLYAVAHAGDEISRACWEQACRGYLDLGVDP